MNEDLKNRVAASWGSNNFGVVIDNSNLNPFGVEGTGVSAEEMHALREGFGDWMSDLDNDIEPMSADSLINSDTELEEILAILFADAEHKPSVTVIPVYDNKSED